LLPLDHYFAKSEISLHLIFHLKTAQGRVLTCLRFKEKKTSVIHTILKPICLRCRNRIKKKIVLQNLR